MAVTVVKNLYKCLLAQGWSAVDSRTNPRAYADSSGKRFGTLERGGVRVALSTGYELVEERGGVFVYLTDEPTDVILRALLVDKQARERGLAGQALSDIAGLADSVKATVFLEPVPLDDKPLAAASLAALYAKYDFQFVSEKRLVMTRHPK